MYANEKVYILGIENSDYENMGTTFLATVFKGDNVYIAHVGDSRLYKISDDTIHQITNDHSYVDELLKAGEITEEEAKEHPKKNIITRAVGTDSHVVVDGIICPVKDDDIILLCSDGLCNMLSNQNIFDVVSDKNLTIDTKLDTLIEMANLNGGLDNISVIIISVGEV